MLLHDRYYARPLCAFVRVRLNQPMLTEQEILPAARANDLRISKFKRSVPLPRITKVLGLLHSFAPQAIMDIGSGRGTFLWPLLDRFPSLQVTAIETSDQRFSDLQAVQTGGIQQLHPYKMSIYDLDFPDKSFEGITFLEVLEHLENPLMAATEAIRVTDKFILLSVPSKPDNNPEHIQFFQPDDIKNIFLQAGAKSVKIEHVLNHRIAIIKA